MGTRSPTEVADPVTVHDEAHLNSWKEIAAYLDTSVRTVQRWEQTEGLPVHRHEHAGAATIYAYTSEVDAWLGSRDKQLQREVDTPPEAKPPPKRLIVLPFRLIHPDPGIEFLSFGLADAITASLSGLDALMVRSSMVAAKYAGEIDLERISSESAVDLVLFGTLLRSGDQLRVTAQLVEAASGTAISSQTVQGSLRDLFQLQDQVVTRIVDSMSLPLNVQEQRLLGQDVPASPAAYEYYLRGNELAYNFDPAARDFYIRSLEEDPNYVPPGPGWDAGAALLQNSAAIRRTSVGLRLPWPERWSCGPPWPWLTMRWPTWKRIPTSRNARWCACCLGQKR